MTQQTRQAPTPGALNGVRVVEMGQLIAGPFCGKTLGAYYSLNSAITLVGELGQTRSKGFTGGEAKMNGVSLGGIIFF